MRRLWTRDVSTNELLRFLFSSGFVNEQVERAQPTEDAVTLTHLNGTDHLAEDARTSSTGFHVQFFTTLAGSFVFYF